MDASGQLAHPFSSAAWRGYTFRLASHRWRRFRGRAFILLHRSLSQYLLLGLCWDSNLVTVSRAPERGIQMRFSSRTSFCPGVSALDSDGSRSSRWSLASGGMGRFAFDRHGLGNSDWLFCLGRSSVVASELRACLPRCAIPLDNIRIRPRAFAGD